MRFPTYAAIAGCTLALAGCNLAPDYKVPTVEVPTQYKEAGPWEAAKPSDGIARGHWWELYGDPTLTALETEIDRVNPDLAAAIARYDQARALAVEAGAPLLPFLNAAGSGTQNRQSAKRPLRSPAQPNQFANNNIGLQATYEIDFWGQLRNIAAAGTANAQASAADLETVRLSLEAELANDYVVLRGLDAQAKLLNDTVESYSKALKLTEDRFRGNIASGIDVSRAQTQLETARAAVAEVQAQRALYEHAIASLVGKPASQFSIAPQVVTLNLPNVPTGVPAALLERRPDIAAAERRMAAANAQIGVAKAAFYPNITLAALGGFQNAGGAAQLLAAPYSFWSVGPGLTLPIFENGLLEAEEERTYAFHRQTSENYRSLVLRAFQEVEDQLALLRDLRDEAEREDAAVKAAEHTLDLSLNLYRDGAVSYLDVTVAQTAALQVELVSLNLTTRRYQANVSLIRALGGGWTATDLPGPDAASTLETSAAMP